MKLGYKAPIWIISFFLFCWMGIIVLSGAGWNVFDIPWDFTNTGAFGDSFGPLSSIMAAIAALSAAAAFRAQQKEIERSKIREQEEDKRRSISEFERTFFQLLEHHRNISTSIDIEGSGNIKTGHDAFRIIIDSFERYSPMSYSKAWAQTSKKYNNDLGHYFRFLYHLVNFVDSKHEIDRYFYARLVRATLSEAEILALALNCVWGEGRDKFKPLVERYAILHNLSVEKVETYQLRDLFDATAFGIGQRPEQRT